MWEAVPPHHEEGEPGWEGTDSSMEAGWVTALVPGLHCPLQLWSGATPVPAVLPLCWQGVRSSGTRHRDAQSSWHPWAGMLSDTCQTCLHGSSVTILPCPHSVSVPCVTCVSPHTSPIPLKWTRQWELL